MATFNTTRLISQVSLKGALPDGRFEDQEILDLASDALISEIAPILVTSREEYYVKNMDYSVVAGKNGYQIPYRSMGGTLREVKLIEGVRIRDLIRIDPEEITTASTGRPQSFYMQGDEVILYPTPSTSGQTLRLSYFVRPSTLVPESECAVIAGVSGNTITVTTPAGWSNANTFDIVRGGSGFSLLGMDLAATSVNSGSILVSDSIPDSVAVGDYVCLAGESCFPYIPADAHQLLVQLTVVSCLEAMGDQSNLAIAVQRAQNLKTTFQSLLVSRVQGAPRRFTTVLI
jgi:hypothetical protein